MAVLIEANGLKKRFGEIVAVDGISLEVEQRRGAGLPRAQRRRQVDDHEDDDRLPGARRRAAPASPASTCSRTRSLAKAQARLPARGRALLRRHDGPRVPRLHRRDPRLRSRRGASARVAAAVEKTAARRRCWSRAIETLSKGFKRRVGHRPGDPARPAGADHGRADRRPRSQPEAPGAQADRARWRADKAIIVSTHILEEVEAVCSRAVIINRGRIVADGTAEELHAPLPLPQRHRRCSVRGRPGRGGRQGAVGVRRHRQGRDRRRRQRQGAAARACPARARRSPPSSPRSSARG